MRVLVTGDRWWSDRELLYKTLEDVHELSNIDVLIEGCCRKFKGNKPVSADWYAEDWAEIKGIDNIHFPADWNQYGKAAGPIRNSQMLREGYPDLVIAFHDDLFHSKGTNDMVKKAEKAGVEVIKISHERIETLLGSDTEVFGS